MVLSDLFALLGPEMIKFAPNFCSCAVDQEKADFQWKRAVSGPSALLGNCFNGNGPFLAHLPFWGPKWSNLHRISAIVL